LGLTGGFRILTILVRNEILTGGVMLSTKVTSKGQITIPKKVRDKLGISQGERILFHEENGVFYIKKWVKKSPFDKWMGYLKKQKGKKPDEIVEELRGK
jgi:AbrB family looped-hinge helix DNA binding protein